MNSNTFSNSRVRGERIIYTASPFARQNLIYLQEIGKSEYLEPYESKRKGKLASYLFCIVKSGSGQLTYHDTTFVLNAGDCIFVNCRQDYTISSKDDLWQLDWVHFNGNSMELIYDKFIERCGGPCFNAVDFVAFEHQHSIIFKLLSVDSYVRDMEIMSELSKLLTMIMKQCWKNSTECKVGSSAKKWIPVKKYIDENYCQSISLEELSEKFTINKFYLTRKFKEEYGCTIYQYITNLRITAAKELLRFTDYNMTEVAMNLGFSDSAYFTRVFTNAVGISPLKFKKQWNVKNG